jgi:hypothetical protein
MEKLDKERYLKRVIVVCWIALAICFGIKLFGGNLFEIICNNENFIKVCEYADNHFWAYYLINAINNLVLSYFFVLAICQKYTYKKWELILLIITVLVATIVKYYSMIFGFVFDIWQGIVLPCIFTIKNPKRHWNAVIGNVLLIAFQFLSLITRSIGLKILSGERALIVVIFSVDVFLMILLYYLYSNIKKKGDNKQWE